MTLIVDDVNRLPAPERALEALQVMATEASQIDAPITFVVPVWKNQLREDSTRTRQPNWFFLDLGQFSQSEQKGLVKTFSNGDVPAMTSVAALLGGDPFLCGLVLPTMHISSGEKSFVEIIKATFESVLTKAAETAVNLRRVQASAAEFRSVLEDFIELCLNLDDPEPTWMTVRQHLDERKSNLLYLLAETNQLIRFASVATTERIVWKHDRLRDALIGRWLAKHVLPKVLCAAPDDDTCLLNPALAEAWAMAFVFAPAELLAQSIPLLTKYQPLALVELLRIRACAASDLNNVLVHNLRNVLESPSFSDPVVGPKWGVTWLLSKTDNEEVLDLTAGLPGRSWHISAARFRNGDVHAGLDLMARFFPESNFADLEECIEAFRKQRYSDREAVAADLANVPRDADSAARLFTLCGYLGWSELVPPSWEAWRSLSHAEQLSLLPQIVWVLNRCGDVNAQGFLTNTLLMTKEIGRSDSSADSMSILGPEFIRPVERSFKWLMTQNSANTWAQLARDHPELRSSVAYMLRHIDYPITLETYVRMVAQDGDRLFDAFEHAETSNLEVSKRSLFRSSIPVRLETRTRLWEIIKTDTDQEVRKWAFRFYRRSPIVNDLVELQQIQESDPLFDEVLRLRLRLRDQTAAEPFIRKINAQPAKWCHLVYFLYSIPAVSDAFFKNLHLALQDVIALVYLENLPKVLPVDGAIRLVTEKGELLKSYPRMWPALWSIGIPTTLAYTQSRIREASHEELEHFFVMEIGGPRRSQTAFDALLPVLDKFPRQELIFLADIAVNSGLASWARANLAGLLNGDQSKYWFTEDDAIETLNDAVQRVHEGQEAVEKTTRFYQLHHERRNTFDVRALVRQWMGEMPTAEQLIVGAMVIVHAGSGEDAVWWKNLTVPEASEVAKRVWTNTKYLLRRRRWQKMREDRS